MDTITFLQWHIPRWMFMWGMAVVMFVPLKWVTLHWAKSKAPASRKAAYLLLWPGMDARDFLTGAPPAHPTTGEWSAAILKTALGIALIMFTPPSSSLMVKGWIAMTGIVLFLHFGTFHLISCFWRSRGFNAAPIMNRPLLATSVSAFWSRHWNVAFRDITHRLVFQPLRRPLGAGGAVFCGFLFSGLLHELVITLPAGGGYGGPTAFFALQGLALLAEKTKTGRRLGLGKGAKGWLYTQFLLIASAPLLFPPAFVLRVINPFIEYLHASIP
jgi:hypothetical protein